MQALLRQRNELSSHVLLGASARERDTNTGSVFVTVFIGDSSREAHCTNGSRRFSREEEKWQINMIIMFPFDSCTGGEVEFPDWL